MTIRLATMDDAHSIAALSAELGPPQSPGAVASRLEISLVVEDQRVLVAVAGDEVVGFAHAFLAPRIQVAAMIELGAIAVRPDQRRRGVGRALVSAIEEWARQRQVSVLRVRSRLERTEAAGFFTRLGFDRVKSQGVFDRELGPGGTAAPPPGRDPVRSS